MKKCLKCNRTYPDETLNFCLDDGTTLEKVSNSMTDENIQRPTDYQTEILPHDDITESIAYADNTKQTSNEKETVVSSQTTAENISQPQIVKQGVSPIFAYLAVGLLGLLVLIVGVGVGFWINSNSSSNTEIASINSNSNESNLTFNEDNKQEDKVESETSSPEKKPTKLILTTKEKDAEKDTKKNETPKPSATTKVSPTEKPTATATPKPETGKFFVILGSFPKSQAGKARQRLQKARSKGLNARIVNTNNHPGLRNGLVAVVMGPFSQSDAQGALRKARSVSSDAYVKAG